MVKFQIPMLQMREECVFLFLTFPMHRSHEHYHNLPLMMNNPPIIVHWIFQMAKSMPERFGDMFKGLVK